MAARIKTADLAARIDGVALCLFGLMGPLLDAIAEMHPDGNELVLRIRDLAFGTVESIEEMAFESFEEEAFERARMAIIAATANTAAARAESGANDNREEPD